MKFAENVSTTTGTGAEQIRVLHVDDDAAFLDLAAVFLEGDGLVVETETDPKRVLGRLGEETFDAVVSDYDMPEVNGLELLRAVREVDEALPFVLFTGKGGEEVAGDALNAGCTAYVQKTMGTETFGLVANRVRQSVSHRRDRAALGRAVALFTDVEQLADVGGWELDLRTGALYWSDGVKRLHEVPSEYVPTIEEAIAFFHPDDRDAVRRGLENAIERVEAWSIESRIVTDRDRTRWVKGRGYPVVEDGEVIAVRGSFQDVTARVTTERRHERDVETLREALRVVTDAESNAPERVERLLSLGCAYLDLPYGFLTRIDTTTQVQTVVVGRGSHPDLQQASSGPLAEAYCRRTIEAEGLTVLTDALGEGWGEDPAYLKYGLGCYLGGTVVVDGTPYGTVCFAGREARAEAFSEAELSFVELLVDWVTAEITREGDVAFWTTA